MSKKQKQKCRDSKDNLAGTSSTLGVFWSAQALIYQPSLSDFRKNEFRESPVFNEGAMVVSVKNPDLGQTAMNMDSVEGDLDCVGPNLSVYEVRNQKKSKP